MWGLRQRMDMQSSFGSCLVCRFAAGSEVRLALCWPWVGVVPDGVIRASSSACASGAGGVALGWLAVAAALARTKARTEQQAALPGWWFLLSDSHLADGRMC